VTYIFRKSVMLATVKAFEVMTSKEIVSVFFVVVFFFFFTKWDLFLYVGYLFFSQHSWRPNSFNLYFSFE